MIEAEANMTDREKDWYFLSVLVEVQEERKQCNGREMQCEEKKQEWNIGCSISPLHP